MSCCLLCFGLLPTVGLVAGPSYMAILTVCAAVRFLPYIQADRRGELTVAFDRPLLVILALFVGWTGLSALWSINTAMTWKAVGQMALISLALALLTARLSGDVLLDGKKVARVLFGAILVGAVVIALDTRLGTPVQHLLDARGLITKYNRGENYLVLFFFPLQAYLGLLWGWRGRLALVALLGVILASGASSSAPVALAVGLAVLVLALIWPRLTRAVVQYGLCAAAVLMPFVLYLLSEHRVELSNFIKRSALHRLEIWNYMTHRMFERPLTGWGFSTSKVLPITDAELSQYEMATRGGIYPHNQMLQLWVETGLPAIVLFILLVILVFRRIATLSSQLQGAAVACVAAAFALSMAGMEVTTDSWLIALAGAAFLFRLFDLDLKRPAPLGNPT